MSRPRTLKANGIVLRLRALGEQDRFITFYTEQHGKITAIAKGIRSFKSRRNQQIELMSRIDAQFWKSRRHYYLTQATAEERFPELKQDMASLTSGTFLIELVDRLTPDEKPNPAVFQLLDEMLQLMSFYPHQHALLREAFLIKLLHHLGMITSFRHCGHCQNPLPQAAAYLHMEQLTLRCENCHEKTAPAPQDPIPLEILKFMHFVLEYAPLGVLKLKLKTQHLERLHELGRRFLYQNVNQPLKSEAFLGVY